jgi:hypothetical protein
MSPSISAVAQVPVVRAVPSDTSPLTKALVHTLLELRSLLGILTSNQYAVPAGELFANSSVGAHVRHSLDHARALADGWRSGAVDYDHRERGTPIETDVAAARTELSRLIALLGELYEIDPEAPIDVCVLPSCGGHRMTVSSTLARELVFVLSHTIHHAATIRSMTHSLGVTVPESFGFAPSTLAHKDRCAGAVCAR